MDIREGHPRDIHQTLQEPALFWRDNSLAWASVVKPWNRLERPAAAMPVLSCHYWFPSRFPLSWRLGFKKKHPVPVSAKPNPAGNHYIPAAPRVFYETFRY